MLVDNKFLFLKIPRTATVAFERSCFLAGLSIKYPADNILAQRQADKGLEPRRHAHQPISKLREYFGNNYPVVAIKRDPLERFFSAWKYTIKYISEYDPEVSNLLEKVDNEKFINAWQSEIGYSSNLQDITRCSNFFSRLIDGGVPYNKNTYMIFTSVITSPTRWHENDPGILYFDMKELGKLEQYTRDITGKPFEFIITNHTKSIKTGLSIDSNLKEFYYRLIEPCMKGTTSLI